MPKGTIGTGGVERYELFRSPLAQRPTQRDIAELVGESRDDLRRLVDYKEQFIVRRETEPDRRGKVRQLAYPNGRLRRVHERLKFHLSKIRQPGYLLSPRKGRGQRDNAIVHLDGQQYLTLDLKKFYPSTSRGRVKHWFITELGMDEDVAGLIAHLASVDDKVSFGSPLTPVLCSLVHRPMFDRIADVCSSRGLAHTVWVDDLTISGRYVSTEVLRLIREIVRDAGLRTHDIRFKMGNRPVFITGVGVLGSNLVAPNALLVRIRDGWKDFHQSLTVEEMDDATQRLLMLLGSFRHIVGQASAQGQKASSEMNSLRQKRDVRQIAYYAEIIAQTRACSGFGASLLEPLPWADVDITSHPPAPQRDLSPP